MTRTLSRYLAAALIEWREAGLLRWSWRKREKVRWDAC
jgi:hypothetical protein